MRLQKIETGIFKLDGGAMFGVVPKTLWQKVYPSDGDNLCNLSLRLLLIEDSDRKILIDTGLGTKLNEKFLSFYHLNSEDTLERSFVKAGIKKTEITDVVLTHLHFDHCGGATEKDHQGKISTTFPNASYHCSKAQWEWAMHPNLREKPSFLTENLEPLMASGQLILAEKEFSLTGHIYIRHFNGHTQGLSVPIIHYQGKGIAYVADLFPTSANLASSWVSGYDTQPLVSLRERALFLDEAYEKGYLLFFEHDLYTECCTLIRTEKGIRAGDKMTLQEYLDTL